MAASPQLDQVIQIIKARAAEVRKTVDDDRLSYERMASRFPLAWDIKTERVGVGGVPAEWIAAPGASEDRVLFYLHGGGYVIGSMRTHREMLSRMSRVSGARVLGLEYRMAPENPFPIAVEDSVAGYRWLLSKGTDPKKIVIGGDSAGGGLVLAALVALRYLGEPMPAAGVCISAWTDMEATGESFITNAESDPSVSRERIFRIARIYMGNKDPRAPLASPIHADLHGLPPLILQVGSIETLLDDSIVFAERAKAVGVDVTVEVWDDMPHVWHHYSQILPEGQQAIDRIGEFVREHIG